jgi:hypothetical protein
VTNTNALVDELRRDLQSEYKITESPSVETFLGIHLQYNANGSLTMSQPGYILHLLEEYDMVDSNSVTTPISCCFNDEDQNDSPDLSQSDKDIYRNILGCLIHLLKTRPDISYAISRLAMRTNELTEKDISAIKRVLRYLKGTMYLGITFYPSEHVDVTKLFVWVDAAHAIHKDGRSHSGYGFKLGTNSDTNSGMFYSRSYKQTNVTLSSTESEINPITDVATEILWFQLLLKELGFDDISPTMVFEDNKSTIALAKQFSGNLKRTKHFIQRIMFSIEQYNNDVLNFTHYDTEDQTADLLKSFGSHVIHQVPKQNDEYD